MCPQIEGTNSRYDECIEILKMINLDNHIEIGITGGEPTLNINKLVELLEAIALTVTKNTTKCYVTSSQVGKILKYASFIISTTNTISNFVGYSV